MFWVRKCNKFHAYFNFYFKISYLKITKIKKYKESPCTFQLICSLRLYQYSVFLQIINLLILAFTCRPCLEQLFLFNDDFQFFSFLLYLLIRIVLWKDFSLFHFFLTAKERSYNWWEQLILKICSLLFHKADELIWFYILRDPLLLKSTLSHGHTEDSQVTGQGLITCFVSDKHAVGSQGFISVHRWYLIRKHCIRNIT